MTCSVAFTSRGTGTCRHRRCSERARSAASSRPSGSSTSTSPASGREFELATTVAGEEFQRRVWELIDRIPYGETTTYGEMAPELGDPALAREVGAAVGRNPLSIVVPCHRVVGKDGKLTGYAGGLERKRFLLELEGAGERVEAEQLQLAG